MAKAGAKYIPQRNVIQDKRKKKEEEEKKSTGYRYDKTGKKISSSSGSAAKKSSNTLTAAQKQDKTTDYLYQKNKPTNQQVMQGVGSNPNKDIGTRSYDERIFKAATDFAYGQMAQSSDPEARARAKYYQDMQRAFGGDSRVLTEQQAEIDRLKEAGLDNNWFRNFIGWDKYNNQDEIDAAEAQYKEYTRLLKMHGMEELTGSKPKTSMINYTRDALQGDLMTMVYKAQGIDVGDDEYRAAAQRVRDFTGSTQAESDAFADASGRWVDKYLNMYDQRMNTLDKYIAKNSSAYGTEYAFNADDYIQYMREMNAAEEKKLQDETKLAEYNDTRTTLHDELASQPDYAQNSQYVKGGDFLTYNFNEDTATRTLLKFDEGALLNELVKASENPAEYEALVDELSRNTDLIGSRAMGLVTRIPYMSAQDRADFYYKLRTQGEGAAFDFIEKDLGWNLGRQEFDDAIQQRYENVSESAGNAALYSAGSVVENIAAEIGGLAAGVSKLLGQEVHEYDPRFLAGELSNVTRSTTRGMIEDATQGIEILGHNIAGIAYSGLMSALDSAANAALFGHAATGAMAAGAFGSSYQENLSNMGDTPDAYIDALVDGAIEAATEYFSVEGLLDDSVSSGFKTLLRQALTEPSEEVMGELMRTSYDMAKYGENSQINQRISELMVMGYSPADAEMMAASEFMSGLTETILTAVVSGAAGGASGAVQNASANYQTGREFQENADDSSYQTLVDLAGTVELSKGGQKIYQDLQSEFGQRELAGGKNAQAQSNAAQLKDSQIAEDLDSESAQEELTAEKNAQAQENAANRKAAEDAKIAEDLSTEDARNEQTAVNEAQAQQNVAAKNAKIAEDLSSESAKNELVGEKKKKAISRAKLGQLYRETMQKLDAKAQDALRENLSFNVAKELKKLGVPGRDAKNLAESILRIQDGAFTEMDVQAVAGSADARSVLSAWTAKEKAANEAQGKVYDLAGLLAKKDGETAPASKAIEADENDLPEGADEFDAVVADVQEREGSTLVAEGETNTLDGEEIEVLGVEATEDAESGAEPKVKIRTADGEERIVDADSIAYGANDKSTYRLAAFSAEYGKNADQMFNAYVPGKDVVEYARAFHKAAQYGSDGRNLDVLKNSGEVSVLNEQQLTIAYEIGRGMRAVRNKAQQAARSIKGENAETGSLDVSQINMASLNKQQRASVNTMGRLAKALGINVRFVESVADEEGRYTTENGSYDASTRTLTLDVHAGSNYASDTSYAVMHTAGHELTHYIKQFADSELWDGYQDFIMGHLDSKMNLEAEIQKRMGGKQQLTRDAAIEEIVADASGEALSRLTEEQIQDMAQENPSLMKKIASFMKRWISNLKKQIEIAFKGTNAKTEVARHMQDSLDEMAAMWNRMLVQSSKRANEAKVQNKAPAAVAIQQKEQAGNKLFIPYAHIDERTLDSVKDIHTELFCSAVEAAQVAYAAAAGVLMDDLSQSVSGQKVFNWDEQGSLTVSGQKRSTSEMLAHMKDSLGWTWEDIRKALQSFIDMGDSAKGNPQVKNTARNRRMEVYLHEVLTKGYTAIDGTKIAPWREYAEMMAEYEGSQGDGLNAKIPEDAIPFDEYAFAGEFDDADDVKYSDRDNDNWYDFSKSFAQQVEDWDADKFPEKETLIIGGTPKVMRDIGFANIPLTFDQKHMRQILRKPKNADHDLGIEFLKELPAHLENPIAIIENAEHPEEGVRIVFAAKNPNADNRQIIAIANVDGGGQINGISIDATRIKTTHSHAQALIQLEEAIKKEDAHRGIGVYYWNKKEAIALIRPGQVTSLGRSVKSGFVHSITDAGSPVNIRIKKQTDTSQFKHWFKGSVVVNEDGTPKVMYHGTPYGGFSVFKDWQYFTENQQYADVYQNPSASSIRGRYNEATNPMTYAAYLSVKKPFDTRLPSVRKIWQSEFYGKWGDGTPLSERGLPDWTEGIDLVEFIEENEYDFDAIILDEGGTGGYGDEVKDRGISVVVRSSNQIKSATENDGAFDPKNPDIYHQERDPDQISDRELLATALQSVTQNADEWDNLRRYQKKIAALNEKQRMLEHTNARIAELSAQNAKANREEIAKLKNAASIYAKQIDRADGELLKYEAMKPIKKLADRERKNYKQKLKAQTDERLRRYKERTKAATQEKIRDIREREAEKRRILREQGDNRLRKAVQKQREVGQRKVDRMKESDMKAKYKGRIQKDVSTMREWLTKPTNKGHVPQFLRVPLADFLESLDFTSDRALKGGDSTQADAKLLEKMDAMRRALANTRKQQSDIENGEAAFRGYLDLPEGFTDQFDEALANIKRTLAQGGGDTPINRMTGEQLKELSNMIRTINTAVRKMNSFLAGNRYQQISDAAHNTMSTLAKLGEKISKSDLLNKVGGFLDWTNTTPYYAFKRFGEGGKAIFEGLMNGWDRLAFNSKELIDYANSAYTTKQVREWSQQLHTIELNGKKVQMTTAQIMSLYCLNKRDQARGHLLGGGIRVADIQMKGKTITQADNHILTDDDIMRITDLLTGEQRAVADKLQHFMNTRCTEWGNEVSMKRFGYEAFGDEVNYFPIETDSNNRKAIDDQAQENSLFRLLNISATKSTVKNANNALVVRDIFDVFSAHGADMAKYNALALPILDALKWYNYVDKTNYEDGSLETESIQKALEKAYGKDAQKYIKNFLRDLNGVREGGRNDGMFNKMLSNYKIAAVAANLRVGMLQITSMPRAAYAIEPKYLAIGAAKNVAMRNSKAAIQNVGIGLWKSLGFYDTNISRNIREMVKHDQSLGGIIKEKSMILAEKGDAWTMGVLYGAVEAEMADKHPGVQKGSEAYNQMVNERMREIVYQTQVVDSTMTRSDIMRDTGAKSSLATAFMSEPTLTMNMLADSIYEQRMKARETGNKMIAPSKKMVKAFAVTAMVMTFSAVMEAAFTAWRDDDEYETFKEKYEETFLPTLLENMNLLNNIPFVKDIVSAIQGNSADRMESAWAYNLWQGVEEIYKYLTGKSTNPAYSGIYKTINGLSQMSGFAVGGLTRELVSMYNNVIAAPMGYKKIQTYNDSAKDAAGAILNAAAAGDEGLADRYIDVAAQHGIEGEKLENAVKTVTGEAYVEGTIDSQAAKQMLITYSGKKAADAEEQLVKWEYEKATGLKYSDMKADYIAGVVNRATVIKYYDESKISKWDYEKQTGGGYDDMREDYISGKLTASKAKQSLMTYGGKTEAKAEEQIDRWDYYEATGDSEGYSKYWRMYYALENGGDFRKYAKAWLDAGMTKGDIARSIAGRYKDEYLAIKGTPAGDRMLEMLLDLYEAIGYNREYERNYINTKWKAD